MAVPGDKIRIDGIRDLTGAAESAESGVSYVPVIESGEMYLVVPVADVTDLDLSTVQSFSTTAGVITSITLNP